MNRELSARCIPGHARRPKPNGRSKLIKRGLVVSKKRSGRKVSGSGNISIRQYKKSEPLPHKKFSIPGSFIIPLIMNQTLTASRRKYWIRDALHIRVDGGALWDEPCKMRVKINKYSTWYFLRYRTFHYKHRQQSQHGDFHQEQQQGAT